MFSYLVLDIMAVYHLDEVVGSVAVECTNAKMGVFRQKIVIVDILIGEIASTSTRH